MRSAAELVPFLKAGLAANAYPNLTYLNESENIAVIHFPRKNKDLSTCFQKLLSSWDTKKGRKYYGIKSYSDARQRIRQAIKRSLFLEKQLITSEKVVFRFRSSEEIKDMKEKGKDKFNVVLSPAGSDSSGYGSSEELHADDVHQILRSIEHDHHYFEYDCHKSLNLSSDMQVSDTEMQELEVDINLSSDMQVSEADVQELQVDIQEPKADMQELEADMQEPSENAVINVQYKFSDGQNCINMNQSSEATGTNLDASNGCYHQTEAKEFQMLPAITNDNSIEHDNFETGQIDICQVLGDESFMQQFSDENSTCQDFENMCSELYLNSELFTMYQGSPSEVENIHVPELLDLEHFLASVDENITNPQGSTDAAEGQSECSEIEAYHMPEFLDEISFDASDKGASVYVKPQLLSEKSESCDVSLEIQNFYAPALLNEASFVPSDERNSAQDKNYTEPEFLPGVQNRFFEVWNCVQHSYIENILLIIFEKKRLEFNNTSLPFNGEQQKLLIMDPVLCQNVYQAYDFLQRQHVGKHVLVYYKPKIGL